VFPSPGGRVGADPNDATLAAYQAGADRYIERSPALPPAWRSYLDRLADPVGHGHVLELGSGPGRDAAYLEQRGVRVTRDAGLRRPALRHVLDDSDWQVTCLAHLDGRADRWLYVVARAI